jgi:hypothetical protein
MKIANNWLGRQLAMTLIMLLAVPYGMAATSPRPSSPMPSKAGLTSQGSSTPVDTAHDSGSASNHSYPDAPVPSLAPSNGQSQQTTNSGTQQTQSTQQTQPVGAAAAPYMKPEGVAASRPAGAAIAPAKQRRVRSFAIRVALLVGAAAAIGTVVAASLGSPSRAN